MRKKNKLIQGFGINDSDTPIVFYDSEGNKHTEKAYSVWANLLKRCYNSSYLLTYPTYVGCSVHPHWKYYKNFKSWFDENYVPDYHLDKDFLVDRNKVYGPDTCIFIPNWLNSFILDSRKVRGDYPVGVSFSKQKRKFSSQISINGKATFLGWYGTPKEAHEVWLDRKLKLAADKKEMMDGIDERLYPRVMEIIKRIE